MECQKTLKLGIIFYMPKTFMKAKGEKYILEKDENNLGIFFCQKIKSKLKEEKYENWRYIFWLTKKKNLCLWKTRLN
jgi:hypothetical protein